MNNTKRRNKGEGSITKLENGKYKVTITLPLSGSQKRKSKTVTTKTEAIKTLKELQSLFKTKENIKIELNKITMDEYAKRFLQLKKGNVKTRTIKAYTSAIRKHISPALGNIMLKDIETRHVNDFLINLNLQDVSKNLIRIILSLIFNTAIEENVVKYNPVRKSIKIKAKEKRVDLILPTQKQVDNLLSTLKEDNYLLYALVYTAIYTGLRRSELRGLKWSNIDENNNILYIKSQRIRSEEDTPKTSSSIRKIYVNKEVIDILKKVKSKNEFVLPVPEYKFSDLKKYFIQAGFNEDFHFHDLRHYHATFLFKKKVDPLTVSKRLGHKDVAFTMKTYTNFDDEMALEVVNVLEDMRTI